MELIEKFENEDTKYHAKLSTYITFLARKYEQNSNTKKIPDSNRFLFCCSLQTWVNDQEVNSS